MGTCPACGEPLTGDSSHCSTCFTRLPEPTGAPGPAATAPPAPTFPSPDSPPPPPPVPSSLWLDGEEARREWTSVPVRAIAIGALVVVALAAIGLVVLGGGDDDAPGSAVDTTSSTPVPLSTTPVLNDEEFVVDVLAADQGTSPLALAEENDCFFRSLVAAMGGAAALRDAGISPQQLSETFGLRGEIIPAGAIDTFLATAAACGLDLSNVLFLRPLSFELGEDAAACVAAGLDGALLNRLIAEFFLDPNRSDTTFVPTPELTQQLDELSTACI